MSMLIPFRKDATTRYYSKREFVRAMASKLSGSASALVTSNRILVKPFDFSDLDHSERPTRWPAKSRATACRSLPGHLTYEQYGFNGSGSP